jgi:hypothetical protein
MTPQQIVALATRLFAIWIAILSFQAVTIARMLQSQSNASVAGSYAVAVVYLVVALLLWCFPMVTAHWLIPRTRYNDVLQLPVQKTVVVACIVLGLTVIALRALPGLTAYVAIAAFWIASGQTLFTMDPGRNVDGVVSLLQLVVGLFLVLKAEMLAGKILPATSGE